MSGEHGQGKRHDHGAEPGRRVAKRSRGQRAVDRERVRVQLERLHDAPRAHAFQRQLFQTIHDRTGDARPRLAVEPIDRDGDFLIAVGGEVLVRSDDQQAAGQLLAQHGLVGFGTGDPVHELEGRVVRFADGGASLADAQAAVVLLRDAGIRATVNYVVPLGYIAKGEGGFENTTVEDDPGPGDAAGTGVRVAVVDTGVAEALRGDGWLTDVERDPGSIDPLYQAGQGDLLDFAAGHGTFVAGVVQQVAPDADIRCYAAVHSDGIGSELDIAAAVVRAADEGAVLINLSLGTETADDQPPVGLEVALEILHHRHPDVLVIAAAGNSGRTVPCWPAAFPDVVGVASLTEDMTGSAWSNTGDWVYCSTVGEGVVSPYVQGVEDPAVDKTGPDTFGVDAWALGTGTSFAAPQITGLVAAELSAHPALTPRQALRQLLEGAPSLPGYGRTVRVLGGT